MSDAIARKAWMLRIMREGHPTGTIRQQRDSRDPLSSAASILIAVVHRHHDHRCRLSQRSCHFPDLIALGGIAATQ
jgi:hypothetical protein